jgi:hypothetical protein
MRFGLIAMSAAVAVSAFSTSTVADDDRGEHRGFILFSPDLASGSLSDKFVLNGFGCSGSNVSPELRWSNVPRGTQSPPPRRGCGHWAAPRMLWRSAVARR